MTSCVSSVIRCNNVRLKSLLLVPSSVFCTRGYTDSVYIMEIRDMVVKKVDGYWRVLAGA